MKFKLSDTFESLEGAVASYLYDSSLSQTTLENLSYQHRLSLELQRMGMPGAGRLRDMVEKFYQAFLNDDRATLPALVLRNAVAKF
jgi:hypothetical protein